MRAGVKSREQEQEHEEQEQGAGSRSRESCHGSTGSPSALSEEGSKRGRDGSRGGKGSS